MTYPRYPLFLALCALLSLPAGSHATSPMRSPPPKSETPHSCQEIAATQIGAWRDGLYWLQLQGQSVQLYCHDMAVKPREYLVVPQGNCSEYVSLESGITRSVQTCFTKVRLDPETLRVDIGDLTFSSTNRLGTIIRGTQPVMAMPYATAMACDARELPLGRAVVRLEGTGFVAVNSFKAQGFLPAGSAQAQDERGQTLALQGGGFCGWMAPGEVYNPFYANGWNPLPDGKGFLLQLRVATDAKVSPVEAPHCYWMENHTHLYKWFPADNVYGRPVGQQECLALDSCSGGGGLSAGGCYKWGIVPREEQWDGVMPAQGQ